MSSPLRTPNGWRCEKQASNLRRANWMDYRNPSILLITMVTTDRRPLFGELQGEKIVLTPLGKQVGLEIERIPHTSQRYRFVAMNMIAEIIANHS